MSFVSRLLLSRTAIVVYLFAVSATLGSLTSGCDSTSGESVSVAQADVAQAKEGVQSKPKATPDGWRPSKRSQKGLDGQDPNSNVTNAVHHTTRPDAANNAENEPGKIKLPPDGILPGPLLKDWPKPQVALMVSGEQVGYIEPCGCTEMQHGGLARRANLVKQMKDRGWEVTAFDLGNVVKRSRQQSKIKYQVSMAMLKDMDYSIMALGPKDLSLGAEFLLSQHNPDAKDGSLPFLAANVTLFGVAELGTPLATRVVKVGDTTIGVTSIVSPKLGLKSLPESVKKDIQILDPHAVLPKALDQLKASKPDLLVLLSHAVPEESKQLAEKYSDFDLIITAGGPEDPPGTPVRTKKPMIVSTGQKGKHVGVVGFYPDSKEQPLRFELVTIDQIRFAETKVMVEHMRAYQDRLHKERVVAAELPIKYPSGAKFVGASACADCHTTAHEIWEKTAHAHAFESLKYARHGQKDHGISRVYDAECLSCHVTGWEPQKVLRYDSGFINAEFAASDHDKKMSELLKGQQCENCHGPGSRHIALIEDDRIEEARKEVRMTLEEAKTMCYKCHDLDNSPNFEFDKYWEKVKHYGLD